MQVLTQRRGQSPRAAASRLRRLALAGVVVGLLAAALGACTDKPTTKQPAESPRAAPVDDSWCASRREPLACVSDDQGLQAIVFKGAPRSTTAVLWDPGGPGLGLPDKNTNFAEIVPRAVRNRNVVLLVEPWARQPPSRACLRSFTAPLEQITDRCELTKLSTSGAQIASATDLVRSKLKLKISGAYLQSFGATRTYPVLSKDSTIRWAVLESPGPPPGTSAQQIMQSRKRAILQLLTDVCDQQDCRTPAPKLLDRLLNEPGSSPRDRQELALGLIALATQHAGNAEALEAVVDDLTKRSRLERDLRQQMLQLGRLYEGRRSQGRLSPSLVGLWADTCPRFRNWNDLQATRDLLLEAYSDVFRPCRLIPNQPTAPTSSPISTLMLTGNEDTVTPPPLQNLWKIPNMDRLRGREHFWDDSKTTQKVKRWIQKHSTRRAR